MSSFFISAKPIFPKCLSEEKNVNLQFYARFKKNKDLVLNITANNIYRAFLNGKLVAYGPARSAHGYARVDTIKLNDLNEENELIIELSASNTKNYYVLSTPPFLQAELLSDNLVLFATGSGNDFVCYKNNKRLQKVVRFSYQRPFSESYDFARENEKLTCSETVSYKLLDRNVDYQKFDRIDGSFSEFGNFQFNNDRELYRNRYLLNENLNIFKLDELEINTNDLASVIEYKSQPNNFNGCIKEKEYALYSFNDVKTGFIELDIDAKTDSEFIVVFDEVDLSGGKSETKDICFYRNETNNVISYKVNQGKFSHISFEPYSFKYIKLVLLKGQISINRLSVVLYENESVKYKYDFFNEQLNKIFDSAISVFKQNAVDILTDCPSRERAGWLCDSYFSAKAEKLLTAENKVETNFLENYSLINVDLGLPKGMIPMCYPAEFEDKNFIPNWSLWYILELFDYLKRGGNKTLVEKSKEKVYGILNYFSKKENEHSFLENLDGWVFIEWSKANDFSNGVNVPTNALYAKALIVAGEMFDDNTLKIKGETIIKKLIDVSFNGEFFVDNLFSNNGQLIRSENTSETCQYYMFFLFPYLKNDFSKTYSVLLKDFGKKRDEKVLYPTVYKSNAFIGNFLRLLILQQDGLGEKILSECVDYFYQMANLTGTLWEYDSIHGSLNHGFASFATNLITTAITGYVDYDSSKKQIYFVKSNYKKDFNVKIPVGNTFLEIVQKNGKKFMTIPTGYEVVEEEVNNDLNS